MGKEPLQITEEDLQKLWGINPLASEQIQKIMLARRNEELQKRIEELEKEKEE